MSAPAVTSELPIAAAIPARHPSRLPLRWLLPGVSAIIAAALAATVVGPVSLPVSKVVLELVDHLPFVHVDSGLTATQTAIVTQVRLPRVALTLLVGALLAASGSAYQGVFRNPLADPYLLGVAAGAGLGVTLAVTTAGDALAVATPGAPAAAFAGALVAVGLTYLLGVNADRLRSGASLILAGVAIAALFTALQTFVLQRDDEAVRDVYAWLLGRFNTATWHEVAVLVPYAAVCLVVLLASSPKLDVLGVGDLEAEALGVHPGRVRLVVVVAASLATAAAVAVSGLIGFVGIIVPHAVRLRAGASYRRILPLAALFGGAFLCVADLVARTALSPAEIPIGVITALAGAPFFLAILRTSRTAGP